MDNGNTPEYLEKIKNSVIENLRRTGTPSTQMTDVPRGTILDGFDSDAEDEADDLDADQNADLRNTQRRNDQAITRDDEFEDSDDEELDAANGVMRQPGQFRRRNITDHPNPHAQDDVEIAEDGTAYLMSGANGTGNADEDMSVDEDGEDDQADEAGSTSSRSTTGRSRSGQAKSELASRQSTPAVEVEEDEVVAEEMDIDEEDLPEEDKMLDDEPEEEQADEAEEQTLAPPQNASGGPSSVRSADSVQPQVTPDLASAQSHPTPPDSPPAAAAVIPTAAAATPAVPASAPAPDAATAPAEDVEMTEDAPAVVDAAKEEGLEEREAENQAAEKAAEVTKAAEAINGEEPA